MAESSEIRHDRPLKGGRSFRPKRWVCIFSIGTLLLVGVGTVWLVGEKSKHQAPATFVTAARVRADDSALSSSECEAASVSAVKTEAGIAVSEDTPWSIQLQSLLELAVNAPDEAIARVASIEEKHERKSVATRVCPVIAKADPAKAMAAAWALELGRFNDEAKEVATLDEVARRWAEVDPVHALKWVSALPLDEESRRDHVVRGIALVLARESPDIAADLLAKNTLSNGSVQIDTALEVVQGWAARDRPAAHKWVEHLAEGALKMRCVEVLSR